MGIYVRSSIETPEAYRHVPIDMVGGALILDKNYVFENITHKLSPSADYGTGGFSIRYVCPGTRWSGHKKWKETLFQVK